MNNDIYNKIADYNDWVRLQPPAGGAAEMKRLKRGKMKDEIKELKKEALEKLGEQENPEPWFSPKEVLDVIAEIESLETEIKQLQAVREAAEELLESPIILADEAYTAEEDMIIGKKIRKLQQVLTAKGKNA